VQPKNVAFARLEPGECLLERLLELGFVALFQVDDLGVGRLGERELDAPRGLPSGPAKIGGDAGRDHAKPASKGTAPVVGSDARQEGLAGDEDPLANGLFHLVGEARKGVRP
jgi:hypothetical protein